MGDADVLAKLSRILETHAINNEDAEDTLDSLLNKIGDEIIDNNDTTNDNAGSLTEFARNFERPTPYEVWKAKQKEKFSFEAKDTKKLSEQQWDRLVDHLHRTNKMKESALMKEQNQGLALELDGLSFKPRMNNTSLQLASTMKSLQHRLPGMLNKREAELARRREEKAEAEVAECTFTPHRAGARTSEKYLQRMGRDKATPEDFFRYHEEKLRRNDQRKQIIEEIESRELTFKPQLNSRSKILQEKLLKSRRIDVDPVSRQTVSSVHHYSGSTAGSVAGSQRSQVAAPEISARAKSYRGGKYDGVPVHDRLYQRAVQQLTNQHNARVDAMQSMLKIPLKPWEEARSSDAPKSWTQNKTHLAKKSSLIRELIVRESDGDYVAVIESDMGWVGLWHLLHGAELLDTSDGDDIDLMNVTGPGIAADEL